MEPPGGAGLWVGSSSLSLSVRWVGLPGFAPGGAGLAGRGRAGRAGSQRLLGVWAGSSSLPPLGPAARGGWLGGCGLWG